MTNTTSTFWNPRTNEPMRTFTIWTHDRQHHRGKHRFTFHDAARSLDGIIDFVTRTRGPNEPEAAAIIAELGIPELVLKHASRS